MRVFLRSARARVNDFFKRRKSRVTVFVNSLWQMRLIFDSVIFDSVIFDDLGCYSEYDNKRISKMASKGKRKHMGNRRTRSPKPPKQKPNPKEAVRKRYLLAGITKLRELIGEEKVTALVRADVDVREQEWTKLLKDDNPEVLDAAATILTGLGLDPDEIKGESDELSLP